LFSKDVANSKSLPTAAPIKIPDFFYKCLYMKKKQVVTAPNNQFSGACFIVGHNDMKTTNFPLVTTKGPTQNVFTLADGNLALQKSKNLGPNFKIFPDAGVDFLCDANKGGIDCTTLKKGDYASAVPEDEEQMTEVPTMSPTKSPTASANKKAKIGE
jgi:hypothetical protein